MAEMDKSWKLIDSNTVFDTPWYRIRKDRVQLPSGVIIDDYYVSELPNVALVFPITPEMEVVFVRQYRHPVQRVLTELPAGTFDKNKETPQAAAGRELLEETGYTAKNFQPLATIFEYPTKDSHSIDIFLARDARQITKPKTQRVEDIEILKIPLSQTLAMVYGGQIQVSGSITAIFLSVHALGLNQKP